MAARVLIVEDNPVNRELLDYLLRAYGFETLRADDGGEGIAVARRERPDLVLCDIQMPGLDGFAFARQLREDPLLCGTPLVAVTAYAMVGDRDRILAQGFDAYLSKPIDPPELIAVVNRLLAAPLRAAALPPAKGSESPGSRGLVLVVDDTPVNLELKRHLLEPNGFEVVTADKADEGLRLARRRRPDLILSDVGMREGDGFDFIRRIKADPLLREVPFIFLSATHWDEPARALGLSLGAVRYLQRPIDPAELLAEIDACLGP